MLISTFRASAGSKKPCKEPHSSSSGLKRFGFRSIVPEVYDCFCLGTLFSFNGKGKVSGFKILPWISETRPTRHVLDLL